MQGVADGFEDELRQRHRRRAERHVRNCLKDSARISELLRPVDANMPVLILSSLHAASTSDVTLEHVQVRKLFHA